MSSFGVILRLLASLAAIAVAITLVVSVWNDTGAATGDVPMRIFLVGFSAGAVIISAGFPLTSSVFRRDRAASRPILPLAVYHVVMGVVIGLAIGTTDWTDLRFAGWWQLWWTVPLSLLYTSRLVALRRSFRVVRNQGVAVSATLRLWRTRVHRVQRGLWTDKSRVPRSFKRSRRGAAGSPSGRR